MRAHIPEAIALAEQRRIGFGATETFTNVEPALYIVDFTNWEEPIFLSRWTPPGIPGDRGLYYSLHNLQVVGTRLYLTNFHGGMWVLNVSDPVNPVPEGLRTPVRDTEYPRPGEFLQVGEFQIFNNVNMYWDVIVVNGYTIVTDMSAGIEVLHVDGDAAGLAEIVTIRNPLDLTPMLADQGYADEDCDELVVTAAMLCIFINGFNLLPLLPFDCGHVVGTILFSRHRILDSVFRILTALGILVLAYALEA